MLTVQARCKWSAMQNAARKTQEMPPSECPCITIALYSMKTLHQLEMDILKTLIHSYFTPAQIREPPLLHINEIRDHISHWYMTHYEI